MEAGSLPPLGPGPVRKTLILQVSLVWTQLTVRFRETSLWLCVVLLANQDWGKVPLPGDGPWEHTIHWPVPLLWAIGGEIGAR